MSRLVVESDTGLASLEPAVASLMCVFRACTMFRQTSESAGFAASMAGTIPGSSPRTAVMATSKLFAKPFQI